MWEFITIFCGLALLFQDSKILRVGSLSLVSISVINWAGGFDYLLTLDKGVIYLQMSGMLLYLLPLLFIRKYQDYSGREWITFICFFVLMSLEGIYLINYKEDIMNLSGFYDALINLICFSALILANIKQGAQNGYNVLSGVLRLFISLRDNTLLHTKVGQLLAKQKGDSGFSSQKIKTEDLNVN